MKLNTKVNLKLRNEVHLVDRWVAKSNKVALSISDWDDANLIFNKLNNSKFFEPVLWIIDKDKFQVTIKEAK